MRFIQASVVMAMTFAPACAETPFSFAPYLFGPAATLSVSVTSIDKISGTVVLSGYDSRRPTIPFTWDWGDGTTTPGFFPQTKVYPDTTRNYVVRVTAHYGDDETGTASVAIRFADFRIARVPLSADVAVSAPLTKGSIGTRLSAVPVNLVPLTDQDFGATGRSTVEYVLTAAASLQKDFVNDNVFLIDGKFQQLMYKDPAFQGMYSLWFTNPVLFAVGSVTLTGSIPWSSFFHEMGHNFTLNTPGNFYYGGRIDGNANAVFSESLAYIFMHATVRELVTNASAFGLDDALVLDVQNSGISWIQTVRASYERYVSSGKHFATWNDPATSQDETYDTFMTVAYTFLKHAETDNMGYRLPLKRMLEFLQLFNPAWQQQYGQSRNDAQAESFRATLMAAALSNAFQRDLRDELRGLGFPLDNGVYANLSDGGSATFAFDPSSVRAGPESSAGTINVTPSQTDATWTARSDQEWLRITSGSAGRGPRTLSYAIDANASPQTRTAVIKIGSASVAVTQTGMTVPFATVSAASFAPSAPLAPGVIAVGYGANLVPTIESAPAAGPLPTVLAQTSVKVRDSVGVERTAPLWFVSPSQINYYISGETALGLATITVVRNSQTVVTGTLRIDTVAPGLFTMNANGQGVPAALAIFARGDGSETRQYVFNIGCQVGSCQPAPLDLGAATDQVLLWLYGTGIRGRSTLAGVSATIGGVNAPVEYAGAVAGMVGLDQVNLRVPRSLIGRGDVDVVVTVDGKTANTVRVNIK